MPPQRDSATAAKVRPSGTHQRPTSPRCFRRWSGPGCSQTGKIDWDQTDPSARRATRHGPDDPSFSDIQQIRQNANRATNLVRQLLAFSRKQALTLERLDVTETLKHIIINSDSIIEKNEF